MTVSTFKLQRLACLDGAIPTTPGPNLFRVGAIVAGGVKTATRQQCAVADLAAVPYEGPPVPLNAQVSLAELMGNVTAILGTTVVYRVEVLTADRLDYDYLDATHNVYDAGLNWRNAGGGDIEPSPLGATFNTPSGTGDQVIVAITNTVTHALAQRLGLLAFHVRLDAISPSSSEHITIKSSPDAPDVGRVRVTWTSPNTVPIDHPQGVTLPGARPAIPAQPSAGAAVATPAAPAAPPRERTRPHGR